MKNSTYILSIFIFALFLSIPAKDTLAHDNTGIKVSATHIKDSLYEIRFDVYFSCVSSHIHSTEDLFATFTSSSGNSKTSRMYTYQNEQNLQTINSDTCINPLFNRCMKGQMEGFTVRTQVHLDPNESYWDIETSFHHTNSVAGSFQNITAGTVNYHGLLRVYPTQMSSNSTPDLRAETHVTGHEINVWDTISLQLNDREHDSVVVRFDSAYSYSGTSAPNLVNHFFAGGNTARMPIDSMSFDSTNHELRFRLNQTGGFYVPFMVYEYDRCTKQLKSKSSSLRILKGLPSTNTNDPVFDLANATVVSGNGSVSGNDIYFAPTDTTMSIEFDVLDTDVNARLAITSNIEDFSSGSTMQITPHSDSLKTVRIDIVRPNASGKGLFYVEVFDIHCPVRYAHEQYFKVHTGHHTRISSPTDSLFKRIGDTLYLCSGDTVPMFSSLGGQAKWRVLSGPAMQLGVNFGNDTLVSTWAAPTATTAYELAQDRNSCIGTLTVRDTLIVKVTSGYTLSLSSSPLAICDGSEDTIKSILNGSVNPNQVNYLWKAEGMIGSNSAEHIILKPNSTTNIFLKTESIGGCIRYASRDVILTPKYSTYTIHHDSSSICTDDSVHLQLNHKTGLSLNEKPSYNFGKIRHLDTANAGAITSFSKSTDMAGQAPEFWPNPLGAGSSKYFRQQFIYRSSEFSFSDTILIDELNLYMFQLTSGDQVLDQVDIKLSATGESTLARWETASILAYSDSLIVGPGKVRIPLSTPIVLAKGQNLLVEFCVSDTSSITASSIRYSQTAFNSCLTFHDNVTSQCSNRNFISWGSQTNRPVMTIGYQDYSPVKPFNIHWSQTSGLTDSTGMHTSVYDNFPRSVYVSFTDTFAACTYRDTLEIDTISSEKVQVPSIDTVCANDSSYQANLFPSGGLYFGAGIDSSGVIYPGLMTAGTYRFAYTLRPDGPCLASDTFEVHINSPLSVSHSNVTDICENEVTRVLQGGSPSGGLYYGSHISQQGVLDVSSLPLGLSHFTYEKSDGHCTNDSQFFVRVYPTHSHGISGLDTVYSDSVNTYLATNTDTANNYMWMYGNGQVVSSSLNSREVTWSATGQDTLWLIGENPGCGIDTARFVVSIIENTGTSITDFDFNKISIKVYPIPASKDLTIQSSAALTSVELYTMDMKLLLTKELPNEMKSNIDVSSLPTGVYFLRLKGEWGSVARRVQLQK